MLWALLSLFPPSCVHFADMQYSLNFNSAQGFDDKKGRLALANDLTSKEDAVFPLFQLIEIIYDTGQDRFLTHNKNYSPFHILAYSPRSQGPYISTNHSRSCNHKQKLLILALLSIVTSYCLTFSATRALS